MRRPRVFCLSLGDWLDEEVPIEWLRDLIALIHATPNLDWLLLTKRPQNWRSRMQSILDMEESDRDARSGIVEPNGEPGWAMKLFFWLGNSGVKVEPFPNIWIGVSAGADQKAAMEIPAKIHFLSCEPMLHALDTTHAAGFDWIIFGGESGKNARPCDVGWIRKGIEFCKANSVAAFVKQFGARPFENHEPTDTTLEEEKIWHRNGWCKISFSDGSGRDPVWNKTYRLRDSHGGDMEEWPEDSRVREFPK